MIFTKILPKYYQQVKCLLLELSKYYDGHENSKFLNQLVDKDIRDPNGYLTLKKEIWCALDDHQQFLGFVCLNYKRGNSVKIGPIIVRPESRGKGVGKFLINSSLNKLKFEQIRKVYATTSSENIPAISLFRNFGFKLELELPEQYRVGNKEFVWGYFFGQPKEIYTAKRSLLDPYPFVKSEGDKVDIFNSISDLHCLQDAISVIKIWHEGINKTFIHQVVQATKRGLDFESKGKIILVTRNLKNQTTGIVIATPKRGGSVKLYPIYGSSNSQFLLLNDLKVTFRQNQYRKLYTFIHASDNKHIQFLRNYGFNLRGKIYSPYKSGHNLAVLDLFL